MKFAKSNIWPAVVLGILLGGVCRVIFLVNYPYIILTEDSYSYYNSAIEFVRGGFLRTFFTNWRMPGYPLVLSWIMKPQNTLEYDQVIPQFFASEKVLMALQMASGLAALIIIARIVWFLSGERRIVMVLTLLSATAFSVFWYERLMLTESLSVFFLLLWTLLVFHLFEKATGARHVLVLFVSWILFLLRPFFLYLPAAALLFLLVVHKGKRMAGMTLLFLLLYAVLPCLFVFFNIQFHGYHGINTASDFNIFGRILQYRLPVDAGRQYRWLSDMVEADRYQTTNPFLFIGTYFPQYYNTPQKQEEFRLFTRAVLKANLGTYIASSLPSIIPAILDQSYIPVVAQYYRPLSPPLALLFNFHQTLRYVCLFFLPYSIIFLLLSVYRYIRTRKVKEKYEVFVHIIIWYSLFISTLGGYHDFSRFNVPSLYLLNLATLIALVKSVRSLRSFVRSRHI